jgi:hypothetical protein
MFSEILHQSSLYVGMEIIQWNPFVQLTYAKKKESIYTQQIHIYLYKLLTTFRQPVTSWLNSSFFYTFFYTLSSMYHYYHLFFPGAGWGAPTRWGMVSHPVGTIIFGSLGWPPNHDPVPQPPKCWDYRRAVPGLAVWFSLIVELLETTPEPCTSQQSVLPRS